MVVHKKDNHVKRRYRLSEVYLKELFDLQCSMHYQVESSKTVVYRSINATLTRWKNRIHLF